MAKEKTDEVEQIESAVAGAISEVKEKAEEIAEKIEAELEELADETIGEKKTKRKTKISDSEGDEKKAKLAALKERLKDKLKAMESKVSGDDKTTLKEKVTGEKEEKKEMLVPIEDYLKSSIHLGTRVITPDMRKCVYRRRADGLAVFNTSLLDDKMREAIDYLAQFDAKDMIVVCKREAGWKAVNMFAETLGIRAFTKKYPAGVLTNTNLENFFETDLVFICDPWLDKNAVADANRVKLKVMSVCDTNNFTAGIDFVLPGNNKSWKSLGMVFYLLTRGYIERRKLGIEVPPIQKFIEGWDALQPPV